MLEAIYEALSFEFMQNALIAGILLSIISGIIGSLVVVNRMVFLAGGIAHASYGGIGIAIYLSFPIFLGASLFAMLCALIIAFITLKQTKDIDTYIGLMWASGMAIGIILIDFTSGYNVDLMSYLFGSILAISNQDLYYMIFLLILIILIVTIYYKDILAVSYDKEYAQIRGINVKFFWTLILVLSSLAIVISIKAVGLILVISLLTIPISIARKLSSSLKTMMLISSLLSSIFTILGLSLSYAYDLTSGASIIAVSSIFFILFFIYNKIITQRSLY
jgi:zinc transport system permease protein